ncbi:SPOR domain-containing protein [Lentibacillus salicampi]|uniref:SPOR domain-containing protein n=1 Tax=Lentibacillus salicampi TaxID=175306 RepID=UPI001431E438|nr:SPOR domain-containing protein [Lentibacillus salicampi]
MGKDQKLVIWMNGKKTKLKKNDQFPEEKYSIKEFNHEHAAALEESDIPELTRQDSEDYNRELYYAKKPRFKAFKPFLVATISAIVIGSVLGFFMLNMFVDINADINQENGSPISAAAGDEDNDAGGEGNQAEADGGTAITAEAVDAFVLQAGKFGEKANADEMAATVQQAGFAAMVWEKGEFFFVLSGIAGSEQQASQLANAFADEGLDVYVKAWQTEANEFNLPDDEKAWLQDYQKQWHEAVETISNGDSLSKKAWSDVVNAIPEKTESLTDLTNVLTEQYQQMGEADQWQDQVILLHLWEQYHQLAVT